MKRLFIHAAQEGIGMDELFSKARFKKRLGLLTTAQHMNQLEIANRIIENSVIGGQIIGCNVSVALRIRDMVDAYLFIGTGKFHPIEIALETGKDVYMANPFYSRIIKLSTADVEKIRKQIKGAYIKFLAAKKIGILVSTKAGQFHSSSYLSLKEKILMAENIKKRIKKEAYI